MNIDKKYGLFINGDFVEPLKAEYINVSNPATGELLSSVARGTKEDVDLAVEAASRAKADWQAIGLMDRAIILQKIAQTIRDNQEEIAHIESLDSGKPIIETREDVGAIADQFDYFAGVIRVETDECICQDPSNMTMIMKKPHGIVAQIIPWNFPFLLAGWKLAPALAAGNCVIIKPAEETPLSLLSLMKLIKDILPAGVVNVVTGPGSVVGNAMTSHKGINKIAFTGSTGVGSRVGQAAAKLIVPSSLELGGKSANIIFPDAPMEKAIEGAALAILYGQGQVCNAGSRLFVHEDVYEEVIESLKEVFESVKLGNPIDEKTRMGTLISEKQLKSVMDYIEIGKDEGARLVTGGNRLTESPFNKGYYLEPTLFADVNNKMRIAQEEIFGPVLVVIPFSSEEEVIEMANESDYGLAGACWTRDINRALRVARSVETGLFWINDYHLAPSGTPFGGVKESGYGRENHKKAIEEYSILKTVFISMTTEASGYYK